LTDLIGVFGRTKAVFLRLYYLVLFSYHMTMYKRAVRNEEKSAHPEKDRGERDGS
jgi:hypothetical protein